MKTSVHSRDLVNIATFNHRHEAEGLQCVLRQQGIDARIQDETSLQRFWFMVKPQAAIHVLVPKQRLADTDGILQQPDMATHLRKAVRCPSCHGCQVQYPAVTRKNLLPALVKQALVLVRVTRHNFYCEHCHFTWTDAPAPPSRPGEVRTSTST